MNASEDEVQAAIDALKRLSLVMEGNGNRVTRYEHNVNRVPQLPPQSVAILALLMLRGPQTPGELRINCERIYKFGDTSSVEVFLHELRVPALALELPRRPGSRENRWAHLLSGAVVVRAQSAAGVSAPTVAAAGDVTVGELAALKANVARLDDEVGGLKATVAKMCAELGISNAG